MDSTHIMGCEVRVKLLLTVLAPPSIKILSSQDFFKIIK